MANETVAKRYAGAVFELAQQAGVVEAVGRDLHVFRAGVYDDELTKGFFLSPVIDRKEKVRILNEAFAASANELALNTLLLLVRKRREALLPEIVVQYDALERAARGTESLIVTSAKQLSPGELGSLVERLEKIYGKRFDVTQRVDTRLIGGVRVTMGDRRIDGSVEGRLEDLTRTLFARN